jgi:hypothetical protein
MIKEYLFFKGVDEVCGFAWESAGFALLSFLAVSEGRDF